MKTGYPITTRGTRLLRVHIWADRLAHVSPTLCGILCDSEITPLTLSQIDAPRCRKCFQGDGLVSGFPARAE